MLYLIHVILKRNLSGNKVLWKCTVKKGYRFSPAGMSLNNNNNNNMSLNNNLIIPGQSLVCDIPAGDRKIYNIFYSVKRFYNRDFSNDGEEKENHKPVSFSLFLALKMLVYTIT
jgi:hypothetical protein